MAKYLSITFPRIRLASGATARTATIEARVITTTSMSGSFENSADLSTRAKMAVVEIEINEVPIAMPVGIARKRTKAGTKRIPPPIPSKPVKKPIAEAITGTRNFDRVISTFELTAGPRRMEIPA
jgi:hypothetical protein